MLILHAKSNCAILIYCYGKINVSDNPDAIRTFHPLLVEL